MSLMSHMEKFNYHGAWDDWNSLQDVTYGWRWDPRRDATAIHDGHEYGESLGTEKHQNQQKKDQDSTKASNEPISSVSVQKSSWQEQPPKQNNTCDSLQHTSCANSADKNKKKAGTGSKKQHFESYMTAEEVSQGLERGELIQGQLRINPKKYQEAFIASPDDTLDIFLKGIEARNRALNGDVVVVKILPREQWKVVKRECEEVSESEVQTENKSLESSQGSDAAVGRFHRGNELASRCQNLMLTDTASKSLANSSASQPKGGILQKTAMVVYIAEKKHSRTVTGFLTFLPRKAFAKFTPVDHRVPRINVPLNNCPANFCSQPGDFARTLFICQITSWAADSVYANGRLLKSLGQDGSAELETEGILTEYGIDFSEFSEKVLSCLPEKLPWTIPSEELMKRRDLRKECVFTIDPSSSKDLDDALSCKQLSDGNFEVGVHVADVSYFVEQGSALDALASNRATSVYLVQKVIPMLPPLLCEELCSLSAFVDRLTFSVVWKITPEGKILSEWFGRSVIHSCAKLSYNQAQDIIETPDRIFSVEELPPVDPVDEIREAVLNLHAIAKKLRAQRFSRGALRMDKLKLAFILDEETMTPQDCFAQEYKDSNKLVEEFMLLANIAAAQHIHRKFPELALLRHHPPPRAKMVDDLQELCDKLAVNINLSSSGALHKSLNTTVGDDVYSCARKEVLTRMCSRPMQMAQYICAGVVNDEKLFRHYALNVPLYTHFTSPIRRYADIMVHRLLAASLNCGPHLELSPEEVERQVSHCNEKKSASKRVQELSCELFFGLFVKECGPLHSEAMVMWVLDQSFDVMVLRYGVQKRIYCKSIEGLNSFRHRKVGKKSELTLLWKPENLGSPGVEQTISIFTLVNVRLKADSVPKKYHAELRWPADPCSQN